MVVIYWKAKRKNHGFLLEEGCFGIPLSVYKEGDFMKTIKENQTNEIVIKNSRFITLLIKINSEEEIKDILQKVKITYHDATHYCYAYVIENINKSSDDGEPVGTAGIPMLNALLKNNLSNNHN